MADTTFPPGLTRSPRVDALAEDAPDVVIRSEVDVGPAKVRRRFTGDRRTFSIQLDLKGSEVATFDEFFLTTTKGGALSFEWKHPRTASLADFRFLAPPQYRPRGPRESGVEWWVVSFDVELLPGTDQSITPPGSGGDPHGGTWLLLSPGAAPWLSGGEIFEVESPAEEFEAIVTGTVFEADAAAPDFVPDLLFSGYAFLADENENGDEGSDSLSSGSGSDSGGNSTGSPGLPNVTPLPFPTES